MYKDILSYEGLQLWENSILTYPIDFFSDFIFSSSSLINKSRPRPIIAFTFYGVRVMGPVEGTHSQN